MTLKTIARAFMIAGGLALAGCAGRHMPKDPPSGAGWRTAHQGFFSRHFSVTSNQDVTKIRHESEQKVIAAERGDARETERLAAGDVATRELLEGVAAPTPDDLARSLSAARAARKK